MSSTLNGPLHRLREAPAVTAKTEYNPTGMFTLVELVTVEMAGTWLASMPADQQRRRRDHRISEYARARTQGTWFLHHQGIAFDTLGQLRDGQHRLHMIIKTGLTTPLNVTRNVPPEAFLHVDQQLPRSVRDAIKMAGEGNYSNQMIAVARMIYDLPGEPGKHRVSREQIIARLALWEDELDFAQLYCKGRGVSAVIRTVVCRAKAILDPTFDTRLQEWCSVLADGASVSDNAADDRAAITFRNFLLTPPPKGGKDKDRRLRPGLWECEKYRKGQAALAAFLRRQPLTKIYAQTEDLFPIPANRLESSSSPESSTAKA